MNLLEKAITDKMNQMEVDQAARFLHSVGQYEPHRVHLNIGRYVENGTVMMLAVVDGLKLTDVSVTGLLNVSEYYKVTYISPEWRDAIAGKLNRNKTIVKEALSK